MNKNTVTASNGTEIYLDKIYELADEFVENEYVGEEKNIAQSAAAMMLFISDRMEKPEHDIDLLDRIFGVFVRVCCKYGILPTLELFGLLVSINNNTFSDWMRGDYRKVTPAFGITAKKWKDVCKGLVINKLSNTPGGNVNLIFIAKSVYGMAETAPVQIENHEQIVLSASALPILGDPTESEEMNNDL